MSQYGHGKGTTQGGFSEYSVVKAKYCYPLKTDISYIDAVLLEPMGKKYFVVVFFQYYLLSVNVSQILIGVAYNGVSKIDVKNQEVLILGAGAIGLLASAVSKALGAKKVVVVDINWDRLNLAKDMGADVLINSKEVDLKNEIMKLTNGDGFPRLIEASGAR